MSRATDDKGQMHTIEGLMASMIMLLVLVLVINNTAVTPLSSSTTNKHVQLELMNMGEDMLASLDYNPYSLDEHNTRLNSPLKESILEWNGSQFVWDGKYFKSITIDLSLPSTDINNSPLAQALYYTFSQYGIAYDVEIVYLDNRNNAIAKKMIWNGDPSDNSVTVSRMVTIHNDDQMNIAGNNIQPNIFYAIPDADPNYPDGFYNIVYVRLTLWRM
jgi:hypothetical protein